MRGEQQSDDGLDSQTSASLETTKNICDLNNASHGQLKDI